MFLLLAFLLVALWHEKKGEHILMFCYPRFRLAFGKNGDSQDCLAYWGTRPMVAGQSHGDEGFGRRCVDLSRELFL